MGGDRTALIVGGQFGGEVDASEDPVGAGAGEIDRAIDMCALQLHVALDEPSGDEHVFDVRRGRLVTMQATGSAIESATADHDDGRLLSRCQGADPALRSECVRTVA